MKTLLGILLGTIIQQGIGFSFCRGEVGLWLCDIKTKEITWHFAQLNNITGFLIHILAWEILYMRCAKSHLVFGRGDFTS